MNNVAAATVEMMTGELQGRIDNVDVLAMIINDLCCYHHLKEDESVRCYLFIHDFVRLPVCYYTSKLGWHSYRLQMHKMLRRITQAD